MNMNLEKEFSNHIKKPISKDEKQMAVNIGHVVLNKKISQKELRFALTGCGQLSEAEFVDPLVEVPAPKDGWLEDYRLKQFIIPSWKAVHKVFKSDLPVGEYNGDNDNASQKVYKAWCYSQARNMKVKSSILDIDFYVTPDMSEEEAELSAQAAVVNHGAKMEQVMKKDSLDVTGFQKAWNNEKKKNPKEAAYAEYLGKFIQAEIKTTGQDFNPKMFVRANNFYDQVYGDGKLDHKKVGIMLFTYWKYGMELAKACGYDLEEVKRARKICMDTAKKSSQKGGR